MKHQHRVLWHDGMFLSAQHFQQADRHADLRLTRLARLQSPHLYGIAHLAIDPVALAAGGFALAAAEGVLPDGTLFACDEPDELPPVRPLDAIFTAAGQKTERLGVHLALAMPPVGALAAGADGMAEGRVLRYRQQRLTLADEGAGGPEREIQVAAPHLRLLFDGENLDGCTSLRIAEVVRGPAGGFAVAEDFAPPALRLSASRAIEECVRRIAEILITRSTEMSQMRRSRTGGMVELAASDIGNLVMLQAVNGHLPRILHQLAERHHHPEETFLELASLAGELCTFTEGTHPKDLPVYRHDAALAGFTALEERLRSMLTRVVSAKYVPIPIAHTSDRVAGGEIPEHVLDGSKIYLGIVSSLAAERILREIPLKAKIGSAGRIPTLIAQALPGIRPTYLAVPPAEIPIQPGGAYFQLELTGGEWDHARKSRSLAIYLPPEFADVRAEFLAVKD